jgi:hypothetical protein
MNIVIQTIPHKSHRYPTVGDFLHRRGVDTILVSDMHNDSYALLVGLHELVEMTLCRKAGVSFRAITAFDKAYEKARKPGDLSEPGDSRKAPYFRQHQVATKIEKQMCKALGIKWAEYNAKVESLP